MVALQGFSSFNRSGIVVSSNVTVPINAVMKVGAMEESITVSGVTPVVDVQDHRAARSPIQRDTRRDPYRAQHAADWRADPCIKLSGSDVGGANSMNQTYVSGHGVVRKETTYQIDGMDIRTLSSDGIVQMYTNEAANQEMTFQTSAIGADTAAGGGAGHHSARGRQQDGGSGVRRRIARIVHWPQHHAGPDIRGFKSGTRPK